MTPQRCFAVVVSMDENAVFFEKDYVRMMYTSIPVNAHAPIKDGTVYALFVLLLTPALPVRSDKQYEMNFLIGLFVIFPCFLLRACFHGGGGPQVGEVTCGGSPHLSCKRDQILKKGRFYGQAGYPTYRSSPTFT